MAKNGTASSSIWWKSGGAPLECIATILVSNSPHGDQTTSTFASGFFALNFSTIDSSFSFCGGPSAKRNCRLALIGLEAAAGAAAVLAEAAAGLAAAPGAAV